MAVAFGLTLDYFLTIMTRLLWIFTVASAVAFIVLPYLSSFIPDGGCDICVTWYYVTDFPDIMIFGSFAPVT